MKKLNILLGLGAVTLLASCGSQKIIDNVKINWLKLDIASKNSEIKNYMFIGQGKTIRYDSKTRKEDTTEEFLSLTVNEDGEKSLFMNKDGVETRCAYLANNLAYEKLLYNFDETITFGNGNPITVDYKGHKDEFDHLYSEVFESYVSYAEYLMDPNRASDIVSRFHHEGQPELKSETEYYSSGDGNLTINILERSFQEERELYFSYCFSYENFAFKSAKFFLNTNSTEGYLSYEIDFSLSVEKEKLSIELPSTWESYLIKDN
ncbi:MAG: hypothetical protein IKI55_01750 [Bacilli bacterium]|nr:hypothetical protein [Bacilli bacterium]MBR6866019.1 hypothetical protein [Bacilli bacterium]